MIPEQLYDAVYWQMFRVESGRPDAEICLAVTLLRAWLALEAWPADSEPRQWLRKVSPVCRQMALASLYAQTNRNSQAIDIYKKLIKKPTITVPASSAQLAMAGLYANTAPEKAKEIYAEVRDHDSKTAAGQIAAQELERLK